MKTVTITFWTPSELWERLKDRFWDKFCYPRREKIVELVRNHDWDIQGRVVELAWECHEKGFDPSEFCKRLDSLISKETETVTEEILKL